MKKLVLNNFETYDRIVFTETKKVFKVWNILKRKKRCYIICLTKLF